jgi:hypothetical protein
MKMAQQDPACNLTKPSKGEKRKGGKIFPCPYKKFLVYKEG